MRDLSGFASWAKELIKFNHGVDRRAGHPTTPPVQEKTNSLEGELEGRDAKKRKCTGIRDAAPDSATFHFD